MLSGSSRLKACLVCCCHALTITHTLYARMQVDLQRADVTGINFVAFRTSTRSTLSAALKLPAELRGAIQAELLPAGSSSSSSSSGGTPSAAVTTAVASAAVDGSGFFEMRGLKPGAFVLRLSCNPAAAGGRSCEPWELPVQVGCSSSSSCSSRSSSSGRG